MRRAFWVVLAVLLGAAARAGAPAPPPALAKFQALAGSWVAAEDGDMVKKGDLVASYHLTGHGSAVVEELFPGTPHAMTTVYFADGGDLVLTHYCMAGNQPRMRAKPRRGRARRLRFRRRHEHRPEDGQAHAPGELRVRVRLGDPEPVDRVGGREAHDDREHPPRAQGELRRAR